MNEVKITVTVNGQHMTSLKLMKISTKLYLTFYNQHTYLLLMNPN